MRALAAELTRCGGAGLANAAFGYGAYALLVRLGLHPLLAQLLAHVAGTAFNARTYAIAFRRRTSIGRFALTYAANYLVGLALLAGFTPLVHDPYLAGALTLATAAVCNFLALRHFAFAARAPA